MGGEPFFRALVKGFYANLQSEPLLVAMYPAKDMEGAERRLFMFLEQYWGGPTTYSDERGHPRLRMRHAGFEITPEVRNAWLRCMKNSLEPMDMDEGMRQELWAYLVAAADSMVNKLA